jgi:hypothetical protein
MIILIFVNNIYFLMAFDIIFVKFFCASCLCQILIVFNEVKLFFTIFYFKKISTNNINTID